MFDFLTETATKHVAHKNTPKRFGMSGHGGADYHLMNAFVSAVAVSIYKYQQFFFCQILVDLESFYFSKLPTPEVIAPI